MDRRSILLDLRNEGKLKGHKPCFVVVNGFSGGVYQGKQNDFIMSIRNNIIYFQCLTFFLHRLCPTKDFSIDIKDYKNYSFKREKYRCTLFLYRKDRQYIRIIYQTGTKETFSTEDNVSRIIKDLELNGIKEIK